MPDSQTWIPLSSAELRAAINPLGAQLSILRDQDGLDLLWNGDPAVWSGRAPVLFPIVGELASGKYRVAGETYHLSRHGFARGKVFEIIATTSSTALLRLRADESTLPVYPFPFELDVRFALNGPTLSVTLYVRNIGAQPLLASVGYHPAFRWPLPFGQERAAHFIEFAHDEPQPVRRLNAIGLLAPRAEPTPVSGRRLVLTDALFSNDAVMFDQLRSRTLTYGSNTGPRIRVDFPDSPYLGVWSKPGAQFICIEPWQGIADPEGFSGEFAAKPGVFTVAPGGVSPMETRVTLLR
jgi:galactose mutarotase-like enzyme